MTPATALKGLADGLMTVVTLGRHRPRPRPRSPLMDMIRAGPAPTSLALAAASAFRRWRLGDPADRPGFEAALGAALRREWRQRCRDAGLPVVPGPPAGVEPAEAGAVRLVTPRVGLDVDFADLAGARTPADQFGLQVDAALDDLVREARAAGVATVGEVEIYVDRVAYRIEHFLHVLAYRVA